MRSAPNRRLGRITDCGLAALVAVALWACTTTGGGAAHAQPLLWRAQAPHAGTIYLLGSVHLGSDTLDLGPVINGAYRSADELVVEIDLSGVTQAQQLEVVQRYGVLPDGRTLEDVLPEATYQRLVAYLDSRAIDRESVMRFKPWFLAFTIVQRELAAAGYQVELGIDRHFIAVATDSSKRIVGLETFDSQLQMLEGLPEALQGLLLEDTLVRADRLAQETSDMMDAWRRGDERKIESLVFQPLQGSEDLEPFYEAVFFERNRSMAKQLADLAGDGKTRFVVLGAGHMVGEQGIPALLARRGYRVERVSASDDAAARSR